MSNVHATRPVVDDETTANLSSFEASAEGSWSPTFWPPAVSIVEPKTVFLPGMFVVLPFFPVYMTLGCCVAFADASCTD